MPYILNEMKKNFAQFCLFTIWKQKMSWKQNKKNMNEKKKTKSNKIHWKMKYFVFKPNKNCGQFLI